MAGRRVPRLNEQLRREVAEVLARQVRDPRVQGVTVTGARATADLDLARIYVRLSSDPDEHRTQMEGLDASSAFIRRVLSRTLQLRRVPQLRFVPDDSQDKAARIEALLEAARSGDPAEDEAEVPPQSAGDGSSTGGPKMPEPESS